MKDGTNLMLLLVKFSLGMIHQHMFTTLHSSKALPLNHQQLKKFRMLTVFVFLETQLQLIIFHQQEILPKILLQPNS